MTPPAAAAGACGTARQLIPSGINSHCDCQLAGLWAAALPRAVSLVPVTVTCLELCSLWPGRAAANEFKG